MNLLDNSTKIKKLDRSGVFASIGKMGEQCWDAWQKIKLIRLPQNYKDFSQIVVCGMGGSALGAHVIESLYRNDLKVPLFINREYRLPGFVNKNSLIILSSYSGGTQETISCAREAIKKKLRCFVIASGGELITLAQKMDFPAYQIKPIFNPCGQPRMAVGYSIFGQLALLVRLGLINLTEKEVKQTLKVIKLVFNKNSLLVPLEQNQAKQIALAIEKKIAVLVTAEHLIGSAHVFNNQLNENAKHFSELREIPELNHHLMEGLAFPKVNQLDLIFVFFDSLFYQLNNRKRFKLTGEVVEKNKIQTLFVKIGAGQNKLEEAFALITLGGLVAFYCAMLHKLDPTPIPWVDFFKQQLEKNSHEK